MKKYLLIIFLLPAIFFTACKKVDIGFGDQFLDNGHTQVVEIDSFTAALSTVYVDSFATSALGVSLVGGYTDPYFGRIDTRSFFEVTPPAYTDVYSGTSFDSLVLILKPNKTFYGDTSKPIHIDVKRLAEAIVPPNEGSVLYNTDQFLTYASPIGSTDITIRPNSMDSLYIRLNDNLGKEFLGKLQDPSDLDMRSTTAFLQYFNGLSLGANTGSSLVFGCRDSAILRVYYSKPDVFLQHKQVDFLLNNNAHHFNQISVNRSGTLLKNISSLQNEIPSSVTNNMAFSQYASGVMTKIIFPSFRDVQKLPNYVKLLKANLVIRPVQGSYATPFTLPPQLRLVTTTQLNHIGADITAASGNNVVVQSGNLFVDDLYGQNTNYSYDITSYLNSTIFNIQDNKNGLLLIPFGSALETTFNRVLVGNSMNNAGKIQLQLYYVAIQ